jgi:hypothetical protein
LALETLFVRDSSPFEQKDPKNPTDRRFQKKLTTADTKWLAELAEATGHGELVVRLEEGREDEPLVTRDPDGTWRAGRYIGSITFKDRTLVIEPRFGDALLSWCAAAFNLVLVETPGTPQYSDWIVPWLIATLWSRSFVAAARHGLPALRTDVRETGLAIRGRLDVQGTIPLRAASSPAAASVRRVKSVEHAISAAIVAAYQELTRPEGMAAEARQGTDVAADRCRRYAPERSEHRRHRSGAAHADYRRIPVPRVTVRTDREASRGVVGRID